MNKIEGLKIKQGYETSEDLFNISSPVDHICGKFTNIKKSFNRNIRYCNDAFREFKNEDYDSAESLVEVVLCDLSEYEDILGEIHDTLGAVRAWGEDWKRLCKRIIEENDIDLDEYI